MFEGVLTFIQDVGAQAWAFGVGVLLVIASLGMLYRLVQAGAAMSFGNGSLVAAALLGIFGIALIIIAGLDLIPNLIKQIPTPEPPFPHPSGLLPVIREGFPFLTG